MAKPHPPASPNPQERSVVTHHRTTIDGRSMDYTATAGTLIIKNEKGQPEASLFYTAFVQDGADRSHRPVTFIYNGGPGCATVPLRMAGFAPRRVVFGNAAPTSGPSYQMVDNQYTLLDKSDLVFIDAPGTGYSRLMPGIDPKDVYGIDQDAIAFASFIERYVTLNERWNSPKYLLGESYGTPRSAVLVNDLLNNQSMAFNGVIMLSSILDFGTVAAGPGNDVPYITYLPTEAAVRWYHDTSSNKGTLADTVSEARTFANGEYATALMQGARLSHDEFVKVAAELAKLTGLSQKYVELADLRIQPQRFQKELLRDTGENLGRYDARYKGFDFDPLGDSQDWDASDGYTSPAMQAQFMSYVRNDLGWKSDESYSACSAKVNGGWDFTRKNGNNWAGPSTSNDLQNAMTQNPQMRVFFGAGYFDMATPFGAAEWTVSHLELAKPLQSHVQIHYYPSGHMVYLNVDALATFHSDLDAFYDETSR
jgi:carboxypeptidase C (cathepsin A)